MKQHFLLIAISLCFFIGFSQAPSGYYNNATGSGYVLKTQLKNIIKNGHTDQGYDGLYDAYPSTDNDAFYEKDNTVLDMYSENPAASNSNNDAYNYQHNTRKCGNYNSENDCYNREHIFPQGFFNSKTPMRSDIHHVVPTDGYVNGRRSNYQFGEVSNFSWKSSNGSKVGTNTFGSFSGTVFEPIDEFKGDIARMLFYFATRYEDDVTNSSWDPHTADNNPLNGTNNQVYENWYIQLLYKWHTEDPVSDREIVRNNAAYTFQGNRNPFIDHPEYVSTIWGSVLSVDNNIQLEKISIYPNPSSINRITITIPNGLNVKSITLYSILGSKIYHQKEVKSTSNKVRITDLKSGIYILKIADGNNYLTKKIIIN